MILYHEQTEHEKYEAYSYSVTFEPVSSQAGLQWDLLQYRQGRKGSFRGQPHTIGGH